MRAFLEIQGSIAWIINNSQPVLTTFSTTKPKCFDASFDFSKQIFRTALQDLIYANSFLKVRGASYLIVDNNGKAHWSEHHHCQIYVGT